MDTFDVAVVIGANDVVNPSATEEPEALFTECPLSKFIMLRLFLCLKDQCHPALLESKSTVFKENTRMLFGDAKESIGTVVSEFKD